LIMTSVIGAFFETWIVAALIWRVLFGRRR
jgi:hypothetical protein